MLTATLRNLSRHIIDPNGSISFTVHMYQQFIDFMSKHYIIKQAKDINTAVAYNNSNNSNNDYCLDNNSHSGSRDYIEDLQANYSTCMANTLYSCHDALLASLDHDREVGFYN